MRSRLFHTIVMVGLSTVACSASKEPDPPAEDAATTAPKKDAAAEAAPVFTPFADAGAPDVDLPDGGWPCHPLPCYV